MNIVSFENIYSLCPFPTFIERRSLRMSDEGNDQKAAIAKYEERGWKILDIGAWDERVGYRKSPFRGGLRHVGDQFTMTIPLDITGVEISSPRFAEPLQDCLTSHSWRLKYYGVDENCDYARHEVSIWASAALKYR